VVVFGTCVKKDRPGLDKAKADAAAALAIAIFRVLFF
jgi:hypothetical protein